MFTQNESNDVLTRNFFNTDGVGRSRVVSRDVHIMSRILIF